MPTTIRCCAVEVMLPLWWYRNASSSQVVSLRGGAGFTGWKPHVRLEVESAPVWIPVAVYVWLATDGPDA